MTASFRAPRRSSLLQVVKSALAAIAAWLVAAWLIPGPLPVFAAIAALLVVQPSLNQSLTKAIERTVGVVAGVLIASGLGIAFGGSTWVILLSVLIAMLVAWALRVTPTTGNQVAISAMLVLALGTATPGYALDRVLETLIGALIGFVVNVALVPPVSVAAARRSVDALGEELAASLERLADAVVAPQTPAQLEELMLTARLMRPMRDAAETAITAGAESLTLNPRARGHRDELDRLQALLDRFTPVVTQVIGMTRAVYDHYEPTISDDPPVRDIAVQLRRAAHDARLLIADDDEPATDTAGVPALTAPLVVARPPRHWILVGSLLEDLRRIHEALGEAGGQAS